MFCSVTKKFFAELFILFINFIFIPFIPAFMNHFFSFEEIQGVNRTIGNPVVSKCYCFHCQLSPDYSSKIQCPIALIILLFLTLAVDNMSREKYCPNILWHWKFSFSNFKFNPITKAIILVSISNRILMH